jgi:Zn-dependent peptidase ImmA (M78 family)/DNA-binding XRE family transcriptional regulator
MSSQSKEVNPNMIILGRESRGLSQKELAEALGVTQGRISKIEMGFLTVPSDLLENLSKILKYPIGFFLQEGNLVGVGVSEIFHRKRQDVPKKVLSKSYAQMEVRLRHVSKLLQAVEIQENVPRLYIDDDYDGSVENIAQAVRAEWQIPRGPIKDLTKTLEDQGVLVISVDFESPKVDAISRWVPGLPPLFFVNQNIPKDRYRLTLAHELGHVVMHKHANPNMEEQANRFAAEFLMPERDIMADLGDLKMAKLPELKRYWRVSMAAILKRAEDLRAITPNQARYLWVQMSKTGYRLREPIELDIKGERPSLINELIEAYREDLGYSMEDLCQMLALFEEELWSMYLRKYDQPPLRLVR